ncbi:MAG TPA: serine/threonine-protein kinase, partial [Gemmatimonadaceae bacterium]
MIDTPRTHPTPAGKAPDRGTSVPISAERWAVLEPLIDAALDLPPEERNAYFDRASDGDRSLRAQIARLVAACERDDALLDAPVGVRFAALLEETPPRILNGRFVIEREIGRGGMAAVYLAHDRKHDRPVAVKILGPDAAAAIGADRFEREIKFAARLHHPNIVPLYDSGDEQGWLYYVMPVMRGGSLRQRLASGAPLPIHAVRQVLHDIAAALSHAHDQNVVHRDVKPENILFDGERAMLADFGVARPPLSVGVSAGTPEYMSPEQADGRGPVEARSDVYSLAVVVQDMLGRSRKDPSAERSLASPTDIPRAAQDALLRALAHDATERFPSASTFEHAFSAAFAVVGSGRSKGRWALGIGLVAALSVGAYAVMATRAHRPNADAFDLYLRGTDQRLFRSDSGARNAVGILSRAVGADSLFPAGFAALAR